MHDDSYVTFGILKNHCGLVTPYDDSDLGNIGLGNGLLPIGTKPLSAICLFIIKCVPCHSPERNELSSPSHVFCDYTLNIITTYPLGQWVSLRKKKEKHSINISQNDTPIEYMRIYQPFQMLTLQAKYTYMLGALTRCITCYSRDVFTAYISQNLYLS